MCQPILWCGSTPSSKAACQEPPAACRADKHSSGFLPAEALVRGLGHRQMALEYKCSYSSKESAALPLPPAPVLGSSFLPGARQGRIHMRMWLHRALGILRQLHPRRISSWGYWSWPRPGCSDSGAPSLPSVCTDRSAQRSPWHVAYRPDAHSTQPFIRGVLPMHTLSQMQQ